MKFGVLLFGCLLACAAPDSRGLSVGEAVPPKAAPSGDHGGPVRRRALVIGNQNYLERPLARTINDANDMADALRKLGFTVDLATDLSKSEIEKRTSRFIQDLGFGDIGWFYYAGHGFQMDGENYLVPVDFHASSAAEARDRGVAFSGIKSAIEKSPAQLSIMVLDACRNNPFTDAASGNHGLALMEAGLGVYIAFAASPGQTALETLRERNGVFTGRLLDALRKPMKVPDLFRQVRQEVYAASNHKQLPYIHDQVIADVSLSAGPEAPGGEPGSSLPLASELFEKGRNLYSTGHCKEALDQLDLVARANPANAYVQNALGLTYVCLHLSSRALEHFSRAIDIQPGYAAAYRNRGLVFIASGQFELAIDDFDWALEREPGNGALYWRRGTAKFGLRHYEEAQNDFTASIALDDSSPYGYHWRGRVLYELGKYREALADFEMALARKHDFSEAIDYRARAKERLDHAR